MTALLGRRWVKWSAGIVAMLLLISAGFFIFLRGGSSTPVSPDTALQRFRELDRRSSDRSSSATEPTAAPGAEPSVPMTSSRVSGSSPNSMPNVSANGSLPPEGGVYVYATRGGDSIDVLGGSKHVYPSRTTISVQHAGCGVTSRWDALEERWDEWKLCRDSSGYELRGFTAYHEFFRSRDTREFSCSGVAYPSTMSRGQTWTYRCVSGDVTSTTKNRALGQETLSIDGVRITVAHIHLEVQVAGEQRGSSSREVWVSNRGLLVREVSSTDVEQKAPISGQMHYHEQFKIELESLTPRR